MPAGMNIVSIDKYVIYHIARNSGKQLNMIFCYSKGSEVGRIAFYPKGQVPTTSFASGNYFYLDYEIDRYQEIIETLRYEKPLFVRVDWNENGLITWGNLATDEEPIGEQEGVQISTFSTRCQLDLSGMIKLMRDSIKLGQSRLQARARSLLTQTRRINFYKAPTARFTSIDESQDLATEGLKAVRWLARAKRYGRSWK